MLIGGLVSGAVRDRGHLSRGYALYQLVIHGVNACAVQGSGILNSRMLPVARSPCSYGRLLMLLPLTHSLAATIYYCPPLGPGMHGVGGQLEPLAAATATAVQAVGIGPCETTWRKIEIGSSASVAGLELCKPRVGFEPATYSFPTLCTVYCSCVRFTHNAQLLTFSAFGLRVDSQFGDDEGAAPPTNAVDERSCGNETPARCQV